MMHPLVLENASINLARNLSERTRHFLLQRGAKGSRAHAPDSKNPDFAESGESDLLEVAREFGDARRIPPEMPPPGVELEFAEMEAEQKRVIWALGVKITNA